MKQRTRNIALTAHLDDFVQSKIDSGGYQSASEVVRESLQIMQQRERQEALDQLREKIRVGYEQVRRGGTVDPDVVLNSGDEQSRPKIGEKVAMKRRSRL